MTPSKNQFLGALVMTASAFSPSAQANPKSNPNQLAIDHIKQYVNLEDRTPNRAQTRVYFKEVSGTFYEKKHNTGDGCTIRLQNNVDPDGKQTLDLNIGYTNLSIGARVFGSQPGGIFIRTDNLTDKINLLPLVRLRDGGTQIGLTKESKDHTGKPVLLTVYIYSDPSKNITSAYSHNTYQKRAMHCVVKR